MKKQEYEKDDKLRAQFTVWLEVVIKRAKLNYLRKQKRKIESVSLDSFSEDKLAWIECDDWMESHRTHPKTEFEFEEEGVAQAFAKLSIVRQKILVMIFVEEKETQEIAKELGCTIQNVYNQRSLAVKELKEMLLKEKTQYDER